jgi:hypothetical protein
MRANQKFVVVIGGRFVTAIGFGHDEKGVVLLFHVAVGESAGPAKLRSANLEPDKVISIIDNSHLVRFRVANAQERLMPLSEDGFWGWTCHLSLLPSNSTRSLSELNGDLINV